MYKTTIRLVCIACVMILFGCTAALSENNIDVYEGLFILPTEYKDESCHFFLRGMELDGNVFYAYMTDNCVYTYEPGGTLEKLCELPSEPDNLYKKHNSMTESETEQLYDSVSYIVAHDGILYGYNVYSGKLGVIDSDGIHWGEQILDFSSLFVQAAPDEYLPQTIVRSYMTENELFTFVSLCEHIDETYFTIYGFDLTSGKSRRIEVDGLCAVAQINQETLLCTRVYKTWYQLCTLNLFTGDIKTIDTPICDGLHSADIGGLAYDKNLDAVFFALNGKVYRSISGNAFEATAEIPTDYLRPDTSAWILPNGQYALLLYGLHIR